MIEADLRAALRLDEAVPEFVRDAVRDEVYRGHCGLIPRDKLSPMVAVQIARDASLAEAMVRAAGAADGAVLIAGGQHARRDLEIVWAGEEHAVPPGRFDYVWYTDPAQPDKDYCADLEARFKAFTKN